MMSVGMPIAAARSLTGPPETKTVFTTNMKFGEVFKKAAAEIRGQKGIQEPSNPEIQSLLKADALEEVFGLLGITNDEGLLLVGSGEEEKMAAMDEVLNNLDDLLSLVNMDLKQLNEIIQELSEEEFGIVNVWDFIKWINEDSDFSEKLISGIHKQDNGAVQMLRLLKLVQSIGENSELMLDQTEQITNLKTLLQTIGDNLSKEATNTSGKVSLEGFQKVVKQAEIKYETAHALHQHSSSETRTAAITIHNPNRTSQAESLAKQIETLLQRSQLSNSNGTTKLFIKLYPEHLGSIRIELVQRDGVMSARLLASTSLGKELLDSQIHQLKQAFIQQNIQLERIDIHQSLQETDLRDRNFSNHMFKEEQHSEQEEQPSEEREEEEKISFKDYLIDEEV